MSTQFPSEQYLSFSPPGEGSKEPKQWAQELLNGSPSVLSLCRRRVVLFDNFPPEYVDYYRALQEAIAQRIPAEQERPFICLNIKGRNRLNERSPADVGMAGGTGPLSDATALENLVRHMSGIEQDSLSEVRVDIAARMENFSGVMYSMPPFRDFSHAYADFNAYRGLYRNAREKLPCTSLHILTNTGHSNKWVFDSDLFFGRKKLGDVDDMTVKVADRIQQESTKDDRVLILGTIAADKAQLYPKLLNHRSLQPILPTGLYGTQDAKLYLQRIIDRIKAGKVTETMPRETRTCGQAFIEFTVHYAKNTNCQSLLFSCTELPMLLHTKAPPDNEKTYLEQLKAALEKSDENTEYRYYDTEQIFVEEIAKQSVTLQDHPAMRSTVSTRNPAPDRIKMDRIERSIRQHLDNLKDKTDEKHAHKRNVLEATLQYFIDGDETRFKNVIRDNRRFSEAFMLWGSTTLALVADGERAKRLQGEQKAQGGLLKRKLHDASERNANPPIVGPNDLGTFTK